MTSVRKLFAAPLLLALSLIPAGAQPKDADGSRDHPLITRYPGSVIDSYRAREYDEFNFPVGPVQRSTGMPKFQHLEGKVTRILYIYPQGRSSLEVFRNYESALKRAGFQPIFTCSGDPCGLSRFQATNDRYDLWNGAGHWQYSGKLSAGEGDIYLGLHVSPGTPGYAGLDIIETKPMEGGLVTVNAAALASDISQAGHAAVYGVYFDTGKAEVKPESAPTLQEIAKLLRQNPALKLYVVGHTDSVGDLAMNMDLSRRRADAVVKALTASHGIAPDRMQAHGNGPLAPVASNKTEEGRAKNRRVDLVER